MFVNRKYKFIYRFYEVNSSSQRQTLACSLSNRRRMWTMKITIMAICIRSNTIFLITCSIPISLVY